MKLPVPRPMWIAVPTVALAVAVVGVQVGWPIYRQRDAIQLIRRLGGGVMTNPSGPDWLRSLIGNERMEAFDKVVGVAFEEAAVTDAELEHITSLSDVVEVQIVDARIGDVGLRHLARLRHLRLLIVVNTQVTDDGLLALKDLPKLDYIDLQKTQITDRGLQHLKGLTSLTFLNVEETNVTDDAVSQFEEMFPHLRIVR